MDRRKSPVGPIINDAFLESVDTLLTDSSDAGIHLTLVPDKGRPIKKNLHNRSMPEFWKLYDKALEEGLSFSIYEKVPQKMSLVFNFSLIFRQCPEEPFPEEFVEELIENINMVITEHIEISMDREEMHSLIFWTHEPEITEEGNVYSLRVHYPLIIFDRTAYMGLKNPLVEAFQSCNLMKHFSIQPIGDWRTILTTDFVNNGLVVLGSEKNEFVFGCTYSCTRDGQLIHSTSMDVPINEARCIFIGTGVFESDLFTQFLEELGDDARAAYYCSFHFYQGESMTLAALDPVIPTASLHTSSVADDDNICTESIFDTMVKRLLPLVSKERATTQHSWLRVGQALWKESDDEEGLKEWIRWSDKWGVKSDICAELWKDFRDGGLDWGVVYNYAMEDNYAAWENWNSAWVMGAISDYLEEATDYKLGKAFFRVYPFRYKYAASRNSRESQWFEFIPQCHRWVVLTEALSLHKKISTTFVEKFQHYRAYLVHKQSVTKSKNESKSLEEDIKKLGIVIKNLQTTSKVKTLITTLRTQYYDDLFLTRINKNEFLIGVNNGVLDFSGNKFVFRNGRPDDFITISTGIKYREYQKYSPLVVAVEKYMHELFMDDGEFDFVKRLFGSHMVGGNKEKLFPNWNGNSNAGKSTLIKLFQAALGDYIATVSPALLTKGRPKSGEATPDLYAMAYTRLTFMNEPESNEPFKKGYMKELTGGDVMQMRKLFGEFEKMKALTVLICVSNDIPPIDEIDDAVITRFMAVPYLSKWTKTAPLDYEEQKRTREFLMNKQFDAEIIKMASAFLWYLCNVCFAEYADRGLVDIPPLIQKANEKYIRTNDIYDQFIKEMMEPRGSRKDGIWIPNETTKVGATAVYSSFKMWYRNNNLGPSAPKAPVARDNFTRKLGPMDESSHWRGWAMRATDAKDVV